MSSKKLIHLLASLLGFSISIFLLIFIDCFKSMTLSVPLLIIDVCVRRARAFTVVASDESGGQSRARVQCARVRVLLRAFRLLAAAAARRNTANRRCARPRARPQ